MRLYKLTAKVPELPGGKATKWAGSMAEVRAGAKDLMEEHSIKRSAVVHDEVEVPVNKVGLLEWLNENVTS
jgi:hypothetical protein